MAATTVQGSPVHVAAACWYSASIAGGTVDVRLPPLPAEDGSNLEGPPAPRTETAEATMAKASDPASTARPSAQAANALTRRAPQRRHSSPHRAAHSPRRRTVASVRRDVPRPEH